MAKNVGKWMDELDKLLEQNAFVNKYLGLIEKKTNIKRRYVAITFITIISVYLVIGLAKDLLCNAIGFVYPAYVSVKAIESKDTNDDTEWLMYWVVFASFSVVEFFSDILLSWFPFYFLGKCVFLLWCMAPVSWNGSAMIYKKTIRPFVLKNEKQIDSVIDRVTGGAKDLVNQASQQVEDAATSSVAQSLMNELKTDKTD